MRLWVHQAAGGAATLWAEAAVAWGSRPHDATGWGRLLHGTAVRLWDFGELEGHPEEYKLFQREDLLSWAVFFVLFTVLIVFDNFVLHRHQKKLSFSRALAYSGFWLLCAFSFCVYVWWARGPADAFEWWTGYLLEWMLSVDNLFVFRSIFALFQTPDDQKHKPLFWGIVGAVFFRMGFFAVEEMLLHSFSWMHFLLGIFLIYTGIKVAFADDDEENPSDNAVFKWTAKFLPFIDAYAETARFVVPVAVDTRTREVVSFDGAESHYKTPRLIIARCGRDDADAEKPPEASPEVKVEMRATRLMLVVICLEVTDIIFAVDSVTAIVAQIPDLFLAYTACVFAMLGLRATFFVIDELVKLFTLLPYAVGIILVLLGAKLMLRSWVHIPPQIVCTVLMTTLVTSMVCSIVYDRLLVKTGAEDSLDGAEGGGFEEERAVSPEWSASSATGP